jgi:HSP20 family molecular chaperone IbpA
MTRKSKRRKFYAYVDESGQDAKGLVFVVSVLVLEQERDVVCEELEKIEAESGKKNTKWNKSRHEFRKAYIEGITKIDSLKKRIFFDTFSDNLKYIELTSFATAKAILKKTDEAEYKVTVFVDGFKKKEIEVFSRGLRDLKIRTRKIRGVKKDENNAFIRLVDAICGLARDANGKNEWAAKALAKLKKGKLVSEL